MNIANFINWFLDQFISIATTMINYLGQIKIRGNISMLDFIITIAIVGMFLPLIITAPSRTERAIKEKKKEKKND